MTKLVQITGILSVKDRKKFRELIPTSFFGGKPKHLAMFDLVCKSKSLGKISIEDRLIQSDLYKMIEKFLVIQKAASDEKYCGQVLLETFRKIKNSSMPTSSKKLKIIIKDLIQDMVHCWLTKNGNLTFSKADLQT